VEYVGIEWATRRAAWCALSGSGEIVGQGVVSADLDGVLRLVASGSVALSSFASMVSVSSL